MTIVRLAIDLVAQTGASLRGAAAGLRLTAERLGLGVATPSASAARSWLLRVGCCALTCPLPSGEWVWLIDHTVQIGETKLLVIVGCLLANVPRGERPLKTSDLQLIHLAPMQHSTSETVAAELELAAMRTGKPREIVSDQGSDLDGGVRIFQTRHADVAHVHDLAHRAANVLKQRWNQDDQWSGFVSQLSQAAAKLRQTREAHLLPPTIRAKARFMNVEPTLRFARRVLRLLDSTSPSARVEAAYGWLRDDRAALANWTSEQAVAAVAVQHIRTHGVSRTTPRQLNATWSVLELTPGAEEVAVRLRAAVSVEAAQTQSGETLVGSTEVLESLFGKFKRLEGSYSGDGFTSLTLALGALVGERTESQLAQALAATPRKVAENWLRRFLGPTVHSLRRLFVATHKP